MRGSWKISTDGLIKDRIGRVRISVNPRAGEVLVVAKAIGFMDNGAPIEIPTVGFSEAAFSIVQTTTVPTGEFG